MATQEQVREFIKMIAPLAQKQAKLHGMKIYPSICIAQACWESGYGTSTKMIKANAVFGIKVGNAKYHFGTAWKDKAYSTKTKECYDGKTFTQITDLFRAYDSIEDAVEDYFDLLCVASRYSQALNQPTPLACIEGIQKAPYATDPNYVNSVMSIVKSNNLTQYDNLENNQITEVEEVEMVKTFKPTREQTMSLQRMLNEHDFYDDEENPLAIDGIIGPKTTFALRNFCKWYLES